MLQLWHLYAAGLVMGVNQTVGFPTQQAFVGVPDTAPAITGGRGHVTLWCLDTCRARGQGACRLYHCGMGRRNRFWRQCLAASLPLVGCLGRLKGMRSGYLPAPRKQRGAGRKASGLKTVLATRSLLFIMISALIQKHPRAISFSHQIVPALMHGNPERNTGLISECGRSRGHGEHPLCSAVCTRKSDRVGAKLSSGTPCGWDAHCAAAGVVPVVEVQALCFFFAGSATSSLFVTSSSAVELLAPPERKSAILGLFSIVTIGVLAAGGHGVGSCGGCLGCSDNDRPGGRVGSLRPPFGC